MDSMIKYYEWIIDNWQLIAGSLYALANVINAITLHHTQKESVVSKYLLWFLGAISIVRSKEEGKGLIIGKLKLPLIPEGKK